MELVYTRLAHRFNRLKRPFMRMAVVKRPGEPISRLFGDDRGQSIDRYWIESYLSRHSTRGPGRAIEVGGTEYVRRFFPAMSPHHLEVESDGTADCVVCNLEVGDAAIAASFDVLIATQVFNFIYETRAALRNAAALLKPGGVMLGSVGGVTQISRYDADRWGHYYSFTVQAWDRLLREAFAEVSIESFGNVDTACAFLNGLATEEVDKAVLDHHDPDYPVSICFRATKA